MHPSPLSESLVDEVLAKLGAPTRPRNNLDGLREIYYRWCRAVPFDNVRKLIHIRSQDSAPLPGDTSDDFFEAWLAHGTGGTCWSGNGALCDLLSALGFDARRAVCTMMAAPDIPPNHGSVTVDFSDERFLVDASILHSEPLALVADRVTEIDHSAWRTSCELRDGNYQVTWQAPQATDGFVCRVEWFDATAEQFQEQHESTRGWSPFNYAFSARLIRDEYVFGAWGGNSIRHDVDGFTSHPLSAKERHSLLVEKLGISQELASRLPEDVEMPPPPTAR